LVVDFTGLNHNVHSGNLLLVEQHPQQSPSRQHGHGVKAAAERRALMIQIRFEGGSDNQLLTVPRTNLNSDGTRQRNLVQQYRLQSLGR